MHGINLGFGRERRSKGGPFAFYQIATRCALPQSYVGQSGGLAGKQVQQASTFRITQTTNRLIFKWANYRCDVSVPKLNAGEYDYTVKAAVLYGGVSYPVTFPSGRTQNVAADSVVASLPVNINVTVGTDIELRWLIDFATAPAQWPVASRYNTDRWNQFGNTLTDEVDTQNVYYSRQTNFMVLPPYQITGYTNSRKAVEIMGDSIGSDGSNDAFIYNAGYTQRALHAAGIPFVNNGASGNSLIYQLESWGSTEAQKNRRRIAHADGAISHVFCPLGTNDLASGATDTQILGYFNTLKGQLDALNIRLIPFTCYPRTNASNTAKGGSDSVNVWTYRRNLNDALRANNGVGYGLVDAASITQDAGNIDLWRSDLGTPTSDGIHPNGNLHDALTAYLTTQAALIINA